MASRDYSASINAATAQYNATLQGYQKTLQQQQVAQQGVKAGYDQLQANVLKGLEGGSNAEKQAISDQYAQESGKAQMALINRGLGNSTVTSAIQRGLALDHAKAQTDRANRFANTTAGYQTQLGLAGLGYAGNALNANMGFAGQGLQYQGQGAIQLGNLAQGYAQLDNQQELQDKAHKQQMDLLRMNQLYGTGGKVGGFGGGSQPQSGSTVVGGFGAGSMWMPSGRSNVSPRTAGNPEYDPSGDFPAYTPPADYSGGSSSGFFGMDNPWYTGGGGEEYTSEENPYVW